MQDFTPIITLNLTKYGPDCLVPGTYAANCLLVMGDNCMFESPSTEYVAHIRDSKIEEVIGDLNQGKP